MSYKTVSGKVYNDSQVEKVGGTYYVKGTSIMVSPQNTTSTPKVNSSASTSKVNTTKISTPKVSTPSVSTPKANTPISSGGYDTTKGYYVGSQGQNDYDRTIEAIQYYEKNGMTTQRDNAVKYASMMGYTTPKYSSSTKVAPVTSSVNSPTTQQKGTVTTNDIVTPVNDFDIEDYMKNNVLSAANDVNSSPFEGTWGEFMNWAQNNLVQPTQQEVNYEDIQNEISEGLMPLHQINMSDLERSLNEQKASLAENLAGRGIYNSSTNEQKAAELIGEYGDSLARANAAFEAQVAQDATSMYNSELSRLSQNEMVYNQALTNLGMAVMNGMIDQQRFIIDDAYRNTVLSTLIGDNVLSNFGTIGTNTSSNVDTDTNSGSSSGSGGSSETGYISNGAYVSNTPGLTERERAMEAINYYNRNGMTDKANLAKQYLQKLISQGA